MAIGLHQLVRYGELPLAFTISHFHTANEYRKFPSDKKWYHNSYDGSNFKINPFKNQLSLQ